MFCRILTKACKRCGGDLSLERDKYGTYFECIQCGAISSELELMYPSTQAASERRVVDMARADAIVKGTS